MHTIELTDRVFSKLQYLAVPLLDTTESVIERLADEKIASRLMTTSVFEIQKLINTSVPNEREVPTDDLTHTILTEATFDGVEPSPMNWKKFLELAHIEVYKRLQSFDELRSMTRSNIEKGIYRGRGFHYVEEIDASIQGVSVKEAWKTTLALAKKLNVPVRAVFTWRDHPESAHPGQQGEVSWTPS